MPLTNATLTELGNQLASIIDDCSLHTADPSTTGANEVTGGGYARQAVTFNVDGDGDLTLSAAELFSGPAGGDCKFIGLWDPDGTTFRGGYALTGDQVFSSGGQYEVTAISIAGTSS